MASLLDPADTRNRCDVGRGRGCSVKSRTQWQYIEYYGRPLMRSPSWENRPVTPINRCLYIVRSWMMFRTVSIARVHIYSSQ
jgi:hypothetical protein